VRGVDEETESKNGEDSKKKGDALRYLLRQSQQEGARRQDRSGDRAKFRNQPGDPGTVPPAEEQPVFVGEAGVGKTAIAEGLAKRIVDSEVPEVLAAATVFSLDMGPCWRAPLSRRLRGRLKQVLKELEAHPNAILFIDEIQHGSAAGATSRRRMGCRPICSSLRSHRHDPLHGLDYLQGIPAAFRKERALVRRFQKIDITSRRSRMRSRSLRPEAVFRDYHR